MYLKKLSLINFKNYTDLDISFSDRINCFVGDNGVGKTNLLDAIHYLSLAKSYFNPIDSQNIRHENDFALIQGEFNRFEIKENIFCSIHRKKRKQLRRNKKEYERISHHIGLFPLVMISPADSGLINESGDERRKFINSVISQYDKTYLENVIQYNHALNQRNIMLKEIKNEKNYDRNLILAWDDQLATFGDKIYQSRKDFIHKLVPVFNEYYKYISDSKEDVNLIYQSQLSNHNMRELLNMSLGRDLILRFTTSGVHKDDLIMNLGSYPLKKTGSQGQQKTFLVALKLAQFDFIKRISNIRPILLLDDIFDKFDSSRVEKIIKLVANNDFGQIFITDTNKSHLKTILSGTKINYLIYHITDDQKITMTS